MLSVSCPQVSVSCPHVVRMFPHVLRAYFQISPKISILIYRKAGVCTYILVRTRHIIALRGWITTVILSGGFIAYFKLLFNSKIAFKYLGVTALSGCFV